MKRLLLVTAFLASSVFAVVEPTFLYEEDPSLLTSNVNVVILSGSADDAADKSGLTKMMAELMLRGTKKKKREVFQSEIERMGATLNVRVQHDLIIFSGAVIRENTDAFVRLIEDALKNPAFDKKEFEALKVETLAEISHAKNSNNRLSGVAVRKTLMAGTVMERPVIGSLETVKKLKPEDVLRAYNDRFSRGNFVFAISAPTKEAPLKKGFTDFWMTFPDGARRSRKSIAPDVPKELKLVVVHKPKTSTGAVMFGQAGITAQDPSRYTLSVANFAFGGEPLVSRLFKTIRSELGWTYAIGSTYNAMGALSSQQGFYVISSTPTVEFTVKTILKIHKMWGEYLEKGLTSDELRLAQDSLVNSYPFEFDSAEKRLWQKVYSHVYGVPILSQDEYAKTIEGISNKNILSTLKDKQSVNQFVISVVADKSVIETQLADEQKDIPKEKQLTIAKVVTPEELIK